MNQILRNRLPPSVRSLLMDIGPKEDGHCTEWADSESETITRDGIVLPSRGTADQEEFLSPANTHNEDVAGINTKRSTVCGLCKSKPSCYTCPRCNVPYCGLACYRGPDHVVCSEEFYKESVLQELKDLGETETEGKKKMQDILLGLGQRANITEGGMESVLREVGIGSDDEGAGEAKEGAQVLELLSRLAELQQSGEGSATEIEGILRKLKEIGETGDGYGELLAAAGVGEEVEGEKEELDLADRLSGLDIDTLSEGALWELMNSQEKEGFMDFIKGEEFGRLVPLWRPWWEVHEQGGRSLVEVLEEEVSKLEGADPRAGGGDNSKEAGVTLGEGQRLSIQEEDTTSSCVKTLTGKQGVDNKGKKSAEKRNRQGGKGKEISKGEGTNAAASSVPPISVKIPKLSSLSTNPSPLVCYGLVNALFGYTFTLSLFNGDIDSLTHEFCDMVLAVSEALNSNRVFTSLQEAIECGEAAILAGYFDRGDPYASARAVEAVAHVMTGRSRQDALGYCLAALSQLRSALSRARAALPKGGKEEEMRRKHFLAGKKCEFFQAWVSDNGHQMRRLAIGLWNEYSKRKSESNTMEKEKRVVEQSWKKGKRKGNGMLIEELS
ncbi:zinc finger HIT domain-containing protein 2 isoform 1-T2 [Polymixia lowei]